MDGDTKNKVKQKLRDMFDTTIEKGIKYDGNLNEMNYYNLICKAAANDSLHNIMTNNVCMFNYDYEDKESILMIFSIPIITDKTNGHLTERIMDIIKETEETFISLDHVNSKEVKEDKFVYLMMVKKIEKSGD